MNHVSVDQSVEPLLPRSVMRADFTSMRKMRSLDVRRARSDAACISSAPATLRRSAASATTTSLNTRELFTRSRIIVSSASGVMAKGTLPESGFAASAATAPSMGSSTT